MLQFNLQQEIKARELQKLVQQSNDIINNDNRINIWKTLLIGHYLSKINDKENILVHDLVEPGIPCQEQSVLDVDVHRTRVDCPIFRSPKFQSLIKIILQQFCIANDFKYKQGMNEILAPFLFIIHANEIGEGKSENGSQLSYQLFESFILRFLERIYFSSDSSYLFKSFRLFHLLLLYLDPEVALYLQDADIPPELYTSQWFLTLFARNLTINKVIQLWDTLLIFNDPALIFFIGTSILIEMRDLILFSNTSRLLEIIFDIRIASDEELVKIIQSAINYYKSTPQFILLMLRLCCTSIKSLPNVPVYHLTTSTYDMSPTELESKSEVYDRMLSVQAARSCLLLSVEELLESMDPTNSNIFSSLSSSLSGSNEQPDDKDELNLYSKQSIPYYLVIDIQREDESMPTKSKSFKKMSRSNSITSLRGSGMIARAMQLDPEILFEMSQDRLEVWIQNIYSLKDCNICIVDMPIPSHCKTAYESLDNETGMESSRGGLNIFGKGLFQPSVKGTHPMDDDTKQYHNAVADHSPALIHDDPDGLIQNESIRTFSNDAMESIKDQDTCPNSISDRQETFESPMPSHNTDDPSNTLRVSDMDTRRKYHSRHIVMTPARDDQSIYAREEEAIATEDESRPAFLLAIALQRHGFKHVSVLDGGFCGLISTLNSLRGSVEPIVINHDPASWEAYLHSINTSPTKSNREKNKFFTRFRSKSNPKGLFMKNPADGNRQLSVSQVFSRRMYGTPSPTTPSIDHDTSKSSSTDSRSSNLDGDQSSNPPSIPGHLHTNPMDDWKNQIPNFSADFELFGILQKRNAIGFFIQRYFSTDGRFFQIWRDQASFEKGDPCMESYDLNHLIDIEYKPLMRQWVMIFMERKLNRFELKASSEELSLRWVQILYFKRSLYSYDELMQQIHDNKIPFATKKFQIILNLEECDQNDLLSERMGILFSDEKISLYSSDTNVVQHLVGSHLDAASMTDPLDPPLLPSSQPSLNELELNALIRFRFARVALEELLYTCEDCAEELLVNHDKLTAHCKDYMRRYVNVLQHHLIESISRLSAIKTKKFEQLGVKSICAAIDLLAMADKIQFFTFIPSDFVASIQSALFTTAQLISGLIALSVLKVQQIFQPQPLYKPFTRESEKEEDMRNSTTIPSQGGSSLSNPSGWYSYLGINNINGVRRPSKEPTDFLVQGHELITAQVVGPNLENLNIPPPQCDNDDGMMFRPTSVSMPDGKESEVSDLQIHPVRSYSEPPVCIATALPNPYGSELQTPRNWNGLRKESSNLKKNVALNEIETVLCEFVSSVEIELLDDVLFEAVISNILTAQLLAFADILTVLELPNFEDKTSKKHIDECDGLMKRLSSMRLKLHFSNHGNDFSDSAKIMKPMEEEIHAMMNPNYSTEYFTDKLLHVTNPGNHAFATISFDTLNKKNVEQMPIDHGIEPSDNFFKLSPIAEHEVTGQTSSIQNDTAVEEAVPSMSTPSFLRPPNISTMSPDTLTHLTSSPSVIGLRRSARSSNVGTPSLGRQSKLSSVAPSPSTPARNNLRKMSIIVDEKVTAEINRIGSSESLVYHGNSSQVSYLDSEIPSGAIRPDFLGQNGILINSSQSEKLTATNESNEGRVEYVPLPSAVLETVDAASHTSCKHAVVQTVVHMGATLQEVVSRMLIEESDDWVTGCIIQVYIDRVNAWHQLLIGSLPSKFSKLITQETSKIMIANYFNQIINKIISTKRNAELMGETVVHEFSLNRPGLFQLERDLTSIHIWMITRTADDYKTAECEKQLLFIMTQFISCDREAALTMYADGINRFGLFYSSHLYDILRVILHLRKDLPLRSKLSILGLLVEYIQQLRQALENEPMIQKYLLRKHRVYWTTETSIFDILAPRAGIEHCTGESWRMEPLLNPHLDRVSVSLVINHALSLLRSTIQEKSSGNVLDEIEIPRIASHYNPVQFIEKVDPESSESMTEFYTSSVTPIGSHGVGTEPKKLIPSAAQFLSNFLIPHHRNNKATITYDTSSTSTEVNSDIATNSSGVIGSFLHNLNYKKTGIDKSNITQELESSSQSSSGKQSEPIYSFPSLNEISSKNNVK